MKPEYFFAWMLFRNGVKFNILSSIHVADSLSCDARFKLDFDKLFKSCAFKISCQS